MKELGYIVIGTGILLVIVGAILLVAGKIPFLGRLPGDINWRGKDGSFHFPITTCVIVSVILTIILNVLIRIFGKR